ncbi:hypothetical protein IAU60_006239 [Kwoniella sp. DSM 27419]
MPRHMVLGDHGGRQDGKLEGQFMFRFATWTFGLVTLCLSWWTYRLYTEDMARSGSWGCEMSWMMPTYHAVDWPDKPSPGYRMFRYREQGWDLDDQVSGHPAIFIPGNAGSYQQVRSIASSSSRQYHDNPGGLARGMEGAKKVDYFTIDVNEEFSAFHAHTLRAQASFLRQAIRRVLLDAAGNIT